MKSLHEAGTAPLAWRPVKNEKRMIELYAGADVFAILRQEKRQPAVAETADGRWTFERKKGTVTIRAAEDNSDVATLTLNWKGDGRLTFARGHTYLWVRPSAWKSTRAFDTETGQRVVQCMRDYSLTKYTDRIEIEPGASASPDIPLLAVLGRYIGVTDDDAGMIGAVVAATVM